MDTTKLGCCAAGRSAASAVIQSAGAATSAWPMRMRRSAGGFARSRKIDLTRGPMVPVSLGGASHRPETARC